MLPTFVVIGAPKAGTTSLYHYLNTHPDILLSYRKEILFFDSSFHKGIDWYKKYFRHYRGQKAIGDISPTYMHNPFVPKRMFKTIPETKIICILRNPIQRAYSHYWDLRAWDGGEGTFREYLGTPKMYKRGSSFIEFDILEMGLYAAHISRYLEYFSQENLHCVFFEDLLAAPERVLTEICSFLQIKPFTSLPSISKAHNSRRTHRSRLIGNILVSEPLRKFVDTCIPGSFFPKMRKLYDFLLNLNHKRINTDPISREDYHYLADLYRNDILILEKMVSRNLSHWLVYS